MDDAIVWILILLFGLFVIYLSTKKGNYKIEGICDDDIDDPYYDIDDPYYDIDDPYSGDDIDDDTFECYLRNELMKTNPSYFEIAITSLLKYNRSPSEYIGGKAVEEIMPHIRKIIKEE